MFTREFIIFVLNHPVVKEFVVWLGDTYVPEETIWATINAMLEAPGGNRGQSKGLTITGYTGPGQ